MTADELRALTAQGPAVVMVAKDDMLRLLDQGEAQGRTIAALAARLTAARNALLALLPLAEDDLTALVEGYSLPRDLPWTPGQPLPPSLSPGEPERLAVRRVNAITAARATLGQHPREAAAPPQGELL